MGREVIDYQEAVELQLLSSGNRTTIEEICLNLEH